MWSQIGVHGLAPGRLYNQPLGFCLMRLLVYPHELSIGGSQINAIDLAAEVSLAAHDAIVYMVFLVRWSATSSGAVCALCLRGDSVTAPRHLGSHRWPYLPGGNLIGPILVRAETHWIRVGFLGGSEQFLDLLRSTLARERPDLLVAGLWSPSRTEIAEARLSKELAAAVVSSARCTR